MILRTITRNKHKTNNPKKIYLVVVVCLLILGIEFLAYYNKNDAGFVGRLLNRTNKFELVCHGVNQHDVTVLWQTTKGTDTIVKNGVKIKDFGYEQGSEDFIVLYKNKVLRKWGFYSANKNEAHNFKIELSKKGDLLELDFSLDEGRQKILLRE